MRGPSQGFVAALLSGTCDGFDVTRHVKGVPYMALQGGSMTIRVLRLPAFPAPEVLLSVSLSIAPFSYNH